MYEERAYWNNQMGYDNSTRRQKKVGKTEVGCIVLNTFSSQIMWYNEFKNGSVGPRCKKFGVASVTMILILLFSSSMELSKITYVNVINNHISSFRSSSSSFICHYILIFLKLIINSLVTLSYHFINTFRNIPNIFVQCF